MSAASILPGTTVHHLPSPYLCVWVPEMPGSGAPLVVHVALGPCVAFGDAERILEGQGQVGRVRRNEWQGQAGLASQVWAHTQSLPV